MFIYEDSDIDSDSYFDMTDTEESGSTEDFNKIFADIQKIVKSKSDRLIQSFSPPQIALSLPARSIGFFNKKQQNSVDNKKTKLLNELKPKINK